MGSIPAGSTTKKGYRVWYPFFVLPARKHTRCVYATGCASLALPNLAKAKRNKRFESINKTHISCAIKFGYYTSSDKTVFRVPAGSTKLPTVIAYEFVSVDCKDSVTFIHTRAIVKRSSFSAAIPKIQRIIAC